MKIIITEKIFEKLYDSWEQHHHFNLKQFCQSNNWDWDIFEDIIDELEAKYLIKHYAQWNYDLTSDGIDFAEKQAIIPKERSSRHRQIRRKILLGLAEIREENGKRERIHFKELCKNYKIDEQLFLTNDGYLRDLGYIKMVTIGCYLITDEGMKHI